MLQSHFEPYKTLKQHIAEVQSAADYLLEKHSVPVQNLIIDWVPLAIKFHDIGKATLEFQAYIKNPEAYKGKKESKSHTPMSLYWWLSYALSTGLDFESTLAIAVAVWKHHSDFPTYEENSNQGIHFCITNYGDNILKKQLLHFDLNRLNKELILELKDVEPTDITGGEVYDYFYENSLPKDIFNAIRLRLKVQLLYSVLLESDKVFLALKAEFLETYKTNRQIQLPQDLVAQHFSNNKSSALNTFRTQLRDQITSQPLHNISLVSLPTGMGKTMVAAEWFLKHRSPSNKSQRKIIVVLPFLSIIDQTVKEYSKLLGLVDMQDCILESHSLSNGYDTKKLESEPDFQDSDDEPLEKYDESKDFLAKIWDKPIVITTFDQFLYALLSSKGKHQMRFHNIADALVIMDEIQALPTKLWTLFSQTTQILSESFNTKFLIMSATQPHFMPLAQELVQDPDKIFSLQNRYKFVFLHKKDLLISDFIESCKIRLTSEWKEKRILIVLNTRGSAKKVLRELKELGSKYLGEVYFISGDVTPKERLEQITFIKEGNPCLVIATQCIEAGVDIDMDFVIRDFAPLDSLIQVAGRGNRNDLLANPCVIEIIKLTNGKTPYCKLIYDRNNDPYLERTSKVLLPFETLFENEIYPIIQAYFLEIRHAGDLGNQLAHDWAQWKPVDVQKILRGDLEKLEFIVLSQDPDLEHDIESALKIEEKWSRKRAIQALSGRIAKISLSVWAHQGLNPTKVARQVGYWWALFPHNYVAYEGLVHPDDHTETILF